MSRVIHFEIHADDPERAVRFYQDLFGWKFSKWDGPMEYWVIATGEGPGIDGGLLKRPSPLNGDGIMAFVCTVDVADLDNSLAKLTEIGGTVALPKMPVPGIGWLAHGKDPEGNVFGLMQKDSTATL